MEKTNTMTTKPTTKKRKPNKLGRPAKFMIGVASMGALLSGWGALARHDDTAKANTAPAETISQAPGVIAAPSLSAEPLPTLTPLPTLPPVPTVAPIKSVVIPTPIAGSVNTVVRNVSGANNTTVTAQVAPVPTLAPLPPMPAPPPPPVISMPAAPAPAPAAGGGGNVTGGS